MTTLTIEAVNMKPELWESKDYGPQATVWVRFTDGTKGRVGAKPDTAQAHADRLLALVGKPGEFDVEPTNRPGEVKVKSYPGKPEGKGKGQWKESWGQSEAGQRFREDQQTARERHREDMSNRRTALMTAKDLAVAEGGFGASTEVLGLAERLYAWLDSADPPGAVDTSGQSRGVEAGRSVTTEQAVPADHSNVGPTGADSDPGVAGAPHDPGLNAADAAGQDAGGGDAVGAPPRPTIQQARARLVEVYGTPNKALFAAHDVFGVKHLNDLTAEQLEELILKKVGAVGRGKSMPGSRRTGWAIMAAVSVAVALVMTGAAVVWNDAAPAHATTPADALATCNAANPAQHCVARGATSLEIHLDNPAPGYTYDYQPDGQGGWLKPGNQIVIPAGFCYRPVSIAVHVQTSSTVGPRNEKVVLRDPTDPDPPGGGNRGRAMGPGPIGIQPGQYADVEYAPGNPQGTAWNKGSWNSTGNLFDWCVTSDYTIGVDFVGEKVGDAFSEFYAIVEWATA